MPAGVLVPSGVLVFSCAPHPPFVLPWSPQVIDILRQRSRPYLFSNTLPPAVVGAASHVFDRITDDATLCQNISAKARLFRRLMGDAGFTVLGDEAHPIAPVLLGDEGLASRMADAMLDEGIYVIGFSFPVVPRGKARIRVQLSAAHTEDDVRRAVDAFVTVGKAHGVV